MTSFYEIIFLVTKPVNSEKGLEEEKRLKINRRKIIRNRFHLWVFLTKNPSLIEERVYISPESRVNETNREGEGEGENEDEENRREPVEESKTQIKPGYRASINEGDEESIAISTHNSNEENSL
eukprot:CAMPEP_0205799350 /NCGR_PEP_ID=MMETSP0205-20121125/586_1 /ASSEMBLY_ACC=CAM_ASM_000278 /TAXON_ID=36767 /ORGANISM="Euplotes focardii, Strain TN1" /LENGTH=123 /DNA_ID=CAMNT_0053060505 /DNA_START=1188 /DNA_END=1556 /DNA_ORIENTATION=-